MEIEAEFQSAGTDDRAGGRGQFNAGAGVGNGAGQQGRGSDGRSEDRFEGTQKYGGCLCIPRQGRRSLAKVDYRAIGDCVSDGLLPRSRFAQAINSLGEMAEIYLILHAICHFSLVRVPLFPTPVSGFRRAGLGRGPECVSRRPVPQQTSRFPECIGTGVQVSCPSGVRPDRPFRPVRHRAGTRG